MTTTPLSLPLHLKRDETGPHATWAMFFVAAILALLIGLSAVDIQRDRSTAAHQAENPVQGNVILDGRGKWGGYL